MSTIVDRMPRMFRKGGAEFSPIGTIVHDDAVDFAGTFVQITDVNDKLEMESFETITKEFTGGSGAPNFSLWEDWQNARGLKFKPATSYITKIELWIEKHTTDNVVWRLGTTLWGNEIASGTISNVNATGYWTFNINAAVNTSTWYYLVMYTPGHIGYLELWHDNSGDNKALWGKVYRDFGGTEFYDENKDIRAKVYDMDYYSSGSYESQSIYIVDATWGTISWSETLDGATLLTKVRTSANGVDWGDWQTVNNGDYIVGGGEYCQYDFALTNATENTELDDINITYA